MAVLAVWALTLFGSAPPRDSFAGLAQAQGRPGASSASRSDGGTQWMSPAVVATWLTEQQGDEPVQLQMLILWRGTPGWFVRPGGSSSSGSGSASDRQRTYRGTLVQGGIRLTFEYNPETRLATIEGTPVDLRENNVVLVDDVDSPSGARVSGTIRLARRMPGSAGQIGLALKTSPEIMSFLRCDAAVPEGLAKAYVERLCLQNIGEVGRNERVPR